MLNRIITTLIIMLFSVMLVSADGADDQGNSNDPNINDRANACYEGGDMEGKCDTEWEWHCGWYIIRLTDSQDEAVRAAFPSMCVSLLPALNISVSDVPGAGRCTAISGTRWLVFGSNYMAVGVYPGFSDPSCTTPAGDVTLTKAYVIASNTTDALSICTANLHPSVFGGPYGETYICDNL